MTIKEPDTSNIDDETQNSQESRELDDSLSKPKDQEQLEEYLTNKVRLRWSRVFLVSIVVAIVLVLVTLLVCWIISFSNQFIFIYLSWIFLFEFGLLFIFGGCIGTVKQSFTMSSIKARLTRGERITGADTKIALGSAYSYIFAGVFLALASLIAWSIGF
ncbi:MAG: hypothetical protein ACTSPM_02660 [Candidatus Heimdallarchaeota archaeon]